MKTLMIAIAAFALMSTSAFAYEKTTTTHTGGDKLVTVHACFPSTGNWVNAAAQSCPDRGSGGWGMSRTTEIKCDNETKGKRS